MKDPRAYMEEIRQNMEKIRTYGQVTPAENALFGMVDGLAGLMLVTLERVTVLEQRLGIQPPERPMRTPDQHQPPSRPA